MLTSDAGFYYNQQHQIRLSNATGKWYKVSTVGVGEYGVGSAIVEIFNNYASPIGYLTICCRGKTSNCMFLGIWDTSIHSQINDYIQFTYNSAEQSYNLYFRSENNMCSAVILASWLWSFGNQEEDYVQEEPQGEQRLIQTCVTNAPSFYASNTLITNNLFN